MSNIIAEARVYQTFESREALNLAYRAFLYPNTTKLTDTAITVYKCIAAHSLKVLGVCFAGIDYIVEMTGLSKSSVMRSLKTLEKEFGAIKRIARPRKKGRQVSNFIVVQPQDTSFLTGVTPGDDNQNDTRPIPDEASDDGRSEAKSGAEAVDLKPCSLRGIEKNRLNNVDAHAPSVRVEPLDLIPDYVPREFAQHTLSVYESQPTFVLELWHKVREAGRKLKRSIDVIGALKAFTELDFRRRRGQIRGDAANYFFGVLVRMFGDENAKRAATPTNDGANPADDTVHGNSVGEPQEPSMKPAADAGNIVHYYDLGPKDSEVYVSNGASFIDEHEEDRGVWSVSDLQAKFDAMFGRGDDHKAQLAAASSRIRAGDHA